MIAAKDFSAVFNGRRYSFKKGQKVEAPAPLESMLKKQGALARAKRKESDDQH